MSKSDTYSRARKTYEQLKVGESMSAMELADRVGVTSYEEKKKVAAFLSQQAQKGRVRKYIGDDKRMYYEKLAPSKKTRPERQAKKAAPSPDTISFGEIGEGIVNYIEKLRARVSELEKQAEEFKEKMKTFSKQKEEFKRLYQESEARAKELSSNQPAAQKTIRLSKVMGE